MGQSRPLFVYFHSILVTISIQIEKSIDGVLGMQDGRRRRNHGAMAATWGLLFIWQNFKPNYFIQLGWLLF